MLQLQANERIILLRRRHWFVLALSLIPIVALMLLAVAAPFAGTVFWGDTGTGFRPLLWFGSLLFFEFLWIIFFNVITDYYLDAWIITSNRLVFIELHGIFRRSLSSIEFGRIQDITISVFGIIPTLFKYGDITIHTAGNERGFTFEQVPRPYDLKDELLAIREKILRGNRTPQQSPGQAL